MPSILHSGVAAAGIALLSVGTMSHAPAIASAANNVSHSSVQLTAGNGSASGISGMVYSGADSPGTQQVGLVVGGTGTPIPNNTYLENADKFLDQLLGKDVPVYGVFTPETGSPLYTGIKSLTFNKSIAEGTTIVVDRIREELNENHTVAILGYSQSSIIMSNVMNDLQADGISPKDVKFILLADPNNDNGGLLERLDGLSFPSIGITFNGATNAETPYDTTIYTQEYDGYADFPKYPVDLLADLNAFMGILYIHGYYLQLTDQQITPEGQTVAPDGQTLPDNEQGEAIDLGKYDNTTYYMVPMASGDVIPLLRPLEDLPLIGKPLAEFLNPTLEQLVNLGYESPDNNQGWDSGSPANPTEFGLFPKFSQIEHAFDNIFHDLGAGGQQAAKTIAEAFKAPSSVDFSNNEFSGNSDHVTGSEDLDGEPSGGDGSVIGDINNHIASGVHSVNNVVNSLTTMLTQAYSLVLPTADEVTSVLINMPVYDFDLFADNITTHPLDAFGLPIVSDMAISLLAVSFEGMTINETFQRIDEELTELF